MASVNISLKKEAYDFLSSLKTENKSFSEIILEFKYNKRRGTTKDLLKFAGCLKDKGIDFDERLRKMREFKESFDNSVSEVRGHARVR